MHTIAIILSRTFLAALSIIELCMIVRAIMSFFADSENPILVFAIAITEPIVIPIRLLLSKIRGIDEMPIDIAFFVTFFVLSLLETLLPTVV